MYSYRADIIINHFYIALFSALEQTHCLDKQIIYGSTMTVQLIVLILNKQIIYGSMIDVQL